MPSNCALILTTGTTPSGLKGLLIDPDRPRADWPEIGIEFRRPEDRRLRQGQDWFALERTEPEHRAAFAALRAAAPGAVVRFAPAEGRWEPTAGQDFLGVFAASLVCGPEDAADLLKLAELTPDRGEDWRAPARWESEFGRALEKRLHPDRDPASLVGKLVAREHLTRLDFESECEMEKVRHEPDEGLAYVRADGAVLMLDHHGAFLMYAAEDGPDAADIGMHGIPDGLPRGLYYFKGTGWGTGPDFNGEYDSGFDVSEFVAAGPEHLALFGATEESYAEEIAEYDADLEPTAPVPLA